jgi:glutathione S-transferase
MTANEGVPMITIHAAYNFPGAPGIVRDIRAFWALEELALPYRVQWFDYMKGGPKAMDRRVVNPFGKIPALEDGAQRLFESAAIVLYLYDNAGKGPQDAHARADVNQWCFAAVNTVEPVMIEILRWSHRWRDRPGRDLRYPEVLEMADERLADLSRTLKERDYLVGNAFGPADILMSTVLDFAQDEPSLFARHPVVAAYHARCHARPTYKKALAKQGEGPKANAA